MFDILQLILGRIYALKIRALERKMGYRLTFPAIADGWLQSWAAVDLTRSWKKFGLRVTGVDYFTLGQLEDGMSTRFSRTSNQFQSWIGAYLVRFEGPKFALQDCLNLAVVDQLAWLGHCG